MSGSGSLLSDWHDIYRAINKLPYNDDPHVRCIYDCSMCSHILYPKKKKEPQLFYMRVSLTLAAC